MKPRHLNFVSVCSVHNLPRIFFPRQSHLICLTCIKFSCLASIRFGAIKELLREISLRVNSLSTQQNTSWKETIIFWYHIFMALHYTRMHVRKCIVFKTLLLEFIFARERHNNNVNFKIFTFVPSIKLQTIYCIRIRKLKDMQAMDFKANKMTQDNKSGRCNV